MKRVLSALALTALSIAQPATAASVATIFGFSGSSVGGCPSGPLYQDADGNLLVTLTCEGPLGHGAVAQIAPPVSPSPNWTETIIGSFDNGPKGGVPAGGVISDGNGGYWGTATTGGKGYGTIFDLRPPAPPALPDWRIATRWTFRLAGDGHNPNPGLAAGSTPSTVFGTTSGGAGKYSHGTVFEIGPPYTSGTLATETIIWKFTGGKDGGSPLAPPITDGAGGLYGTTDGGGAFNSGTIYHLTPPTVAGKPWTMTVLYSFNPDTDGTVPEGALLLSNGNLYGVCEGGGTPGPGTVWRLVRSTVNKKAVWNFDLMLSYNRTNGAEPYSAVSHIGSLFYANAYYGGGGAGAGYGTMTSLLFSTAKKTWTAKTAIAFNQGNGAYPDGPLLQGLGGTIYGTTVGGILGYGQIFTFKP